MNLRSLLLRFFCFLRPLLFLLLSLATYASETPQALEDDVKENATTIAVSTETMTGTTDVFPATFQSQGVNYQILFPNCVEIQCADNQQPLKRRQQQLPWAALTIPQEGPSFPP